MKLNKYLTVFTIIFIVLNASLLIGLKKYWPLLLHHTVYYCQEMVKTLPINLPENAGIAVIFFLTMILLVTAIKFILTVSRIYNFSNYLAKNIVKKIQSRVLVVNSPKPFALCFGIRQPKIYVSTKMIKILSGPELETVLRHEKYHLENRDTLTLMLTTIIESLLPYFPLLSDLIRNYRIERELLADKTAGAGLKGSKYLANVLTKLLEYEPNLTFSGAPAIADIETLEIRIKTLLNKKICFRQPNRKNIIISLISTGILLSLAFTPVKAVEFHNQGKDILVLSSTIDNSCYSYYSM